MTVAAPSPTPAGGLPAEAIRRFRDGRRDARIAVLDVSGDEQPGALARHRVDAVLTSGEPRSAGLTSEPLTEEPLCGLVTAGHPLSTGAHMPLSVLAEEPFLFPVHERRHCWSLLRDPADWGVRRCRPP
ncbi:LysR substrate-binding domain-containing protein [Streptomyces olivaceoviridis]